MPSSTEVHQRDTALATARAVASGRTLNQWPLAAILVCLAASLAITATGHWKRGSFAIGCTVVLAGILRAVLPSRVAGLLAVRSRWFDTALMLLTGGIVLAVTLVVPHSKPGMG